MTWSISHPLCLIIIVAKHELRLDAFLKLLQSIDIAKASGYRKIVDISAMADSVPIRTVREIARIVRRRERGLAVGPIAVVAEGDAGLRASEAFAEAAKGQRLIKVFDSRRSARRWLDSFYSF